MRRGCAVAIAACLIGGCAEKRVLTWDDAAPTHQSAASARGGDADRLLEPPPSMTFEVAQNHPRERAGYAIDVALRQFHARRAAQSGLPRTSPLHGESWLALLEAIDEACERAPVADDLGAFVRARVTLEVELQRDRERRVRLPKDLGARVARVLGSVDARVHELRMSGALGPPRPVPPIGDGVLVLHAPVTPMLVTSEFGLRKDPVHGMRRFHAGVDLGAPEGTMVYAAESGVVIYAGWQGGFGRHVVLDHGDGIRTHYSHLSQLFVKPGEIVERGDTIGAVGSTGRATGPHLHFAVTNAEGHFLDPLTVIGTPLLPRERRARTALLDERRGRQAAGAPSR